MTDPNENQLKKPSCKYFEDTVHQRSPTGTQKSFQLQYLHDELLDKRLSKKVQLKEHQSVELNYTEKLAAELSDYKRKQFAEAKRRQQLREANQELKELETKLRAAYVSKALAVQLAEREAARRLEQDLQRHENELIEKARISNKEREQMELQEEYKKKMNLKQQLLDQMEEKNQQRALQYREFLKEKEIIDEIIRKIYEEQLEEMREKLSRKLQFKEEIDEFVRLQRIWQEKQQKETEEENQRLLQLMKDKDDEAEMRAEMHRKQLEMRHELSQKIGNEILAVETQKRSRQEKLQNLYIAERKALDEEKLREEMEKKLRERLITLLQLEVQTKELKDRRLLQEAEDRRYMEELMSSFAKAAEIAKVEDKKKQEKLALMQKTIRDDLEEKKRRRAEEFAIILKIREQDLLEEKQKQEIIEQERIRMLKEHAINLLGYLPPGILKESDREHLPLPSKN